MGTSAKATMQATEDQTARFTGSSTAFRSARMPPKAKTITAVVVRRGSQSHQMPQVGLAQIAPCVQRSSESTTPISIAASSRLSHFQELVKRKKTAHTYANVSASIAFQAVGTCTYMMRCTSPMKTSAGAFASPQYEPMQSRMAPSATSAWGAGSFAASGSPGARRARRHPALHRLVLGAREGARGSLHGRRATHHVRARAHRLERDAGADVRVRVRR